MSSAYRDQRGPPEAERGREREGGFLSSIFGGGSRSEPPPQRPTGSPWGPPGAGGYGQPNPGYGQPGPYAGPQPGPWGGQPGMMGGMQPQAGGGGFLRSALTTAAGVAGGMVVGNALMNAFGGGQHQALGGFSSSDLAALGGGDKTGENNLSGSGSEAGGGNFADLSPFGGGQADPSFQDASYDPDEDYGGDGGDGGDWT